MATSRMKNTWTSFAMSNLDKMLAKPDLHNHLFLFLGLIGLVRDNRTDHEWQEITDLPWYVQGKITTHRWCGFSLSWQLAHWKHIKLLGVPNDPGKYPNWFYDAKYAPVWGMFGKRGAPRLHWSIYFEWRGKTHLIAARQPGLAHIEFGNVFLDRYSCILCEMIQFVLAPFDGLRQAWIREVFKRSGRCRFEYIQIYQGTLKELDAELYGYPWAQESDHLYVYTQCINPDTNSAGGRPCDQWWCLVGTDHAPRLGLKPERDGIDRQDRLRG